MSNNRKQQVMGFLDTITQKELEYYVRERKLNNLTNELINKIKSRKPKNHIEKVGINLSEKIGENLSSYYKYGQAFIIAFVLECFYDKKYKIKDLKEYLKEMIDADEELRNMVYDCMKDF